MENYFGRKFAGNLICVRLPVPEDNQVNSRLKCSEALITDTYI